MNKQENKLIVINGTSGFPNLPTEEQKQRVKENIDKKTVNLATKFCANHLMLELIGNAIFAQTTHENLNEAEINADLAENLMVRIDENADSLNRILEKTNLKDANVFNQCTQMLRDLIDQQHKLVTKLVAIDNEEV